MDLKKEIKLSDLVPKRRAKAPKEAGPEAAEATEAAAKPEKKAGKSSFLKMELSFKRKPKPKKVKGDAAEDEERPKKERRKRVRRFGAARPKRAKKLVGLKIGGSQLAAARIVNNGAPELVQAAPEDLDPG